MNIIYIYIYRYMPTKIGILYPMVIPCFCFIQTLHLCIAALRIISRLLWKLVAGKYKHGGGINGNKLGPWYILVWWYHRQYFLGPFPEI